MDRNTSEAPYTQCQSNFAVKGLKCKVTVKICQNVQKFQAVSVVVDEFQYFVCGDRQVLVNVLMILNIALAV